MDYESLLKLPGSEDIELLFRTGRGSTYAYYKDNTTTRNRSSEKHTDKSTGIQPRSGKTVFMSEDSVNRIAGLFQNPDMATRFIPVLDKEGKPTGKAKLELLEDYGPRKAGSTLAIVDYKTKPEVGLSPVEVYASESKTGDSGRYIHFGNKITEVKPKPMGTKVGKLAGLASLFGMGSTKASEVASEVGEALLPPGLTPSPLASGTLTPEQKAVSDAAYEEKLAREKEARIQAQQSKMKAQSLMRRGVVLPEERLIGWGEVKNEEVKMAKGGMMKPTIKGFQDGGMNVDPVSGNEVPTGSLPEEVRDDVDAKLSPGEFVIPADVVRFIGLERLMKMRDEAKKGLERMSQIGQMGNAEEVGEESNSTYEDDDFESEIDDILGEIESEKGDVNDQTETMMAAGGFIKSGTDLTKAPKNPIFDVRYYKRDKDGAVMYITHINGKPMTPIPEGFKQVAQEEAQKVGLAADEAKTASKAATTSVADTTNIDGRGTDAGGVRGTGPGGSLQLSDLDMGAQVSSNAVKGAAAVGAFLGIPGMGFAVSKADQIAGYLSGVSGRAAGAANINAMAQELGVDPNTTAGRAAASSALDSLSANLGGPAATSGTGGTGGAAASAGAAAASAAASAGYSQSAIGAAAQAAANAIIGGKSAAEAAAAGQQAAQAAQASQAEAAGSGGGGGDYGGVGGTTGGGDTMGFGGEYAEGGLVNRRQYPAKKKRGKGIAASK
jgi:hypothetical protein